VSPAHDVLRRWDLSCATGIVLFVGIALVFAACSPNLGHERVTFSFENRTDSVLCYYPSQEDASAAPCVQRVNPRTETTFSPGRGYGNEADEIPVTVILTTEANERAIYQRTEKCHIWQESDRTFVVQKDGAEFVVTDSLPEAPPSP
jgi:hypothetical protein